MPAAEAAPARWGRRAVNALFLCGGLLTAGFALFEGQRQFRADWMAQGPRHFVGQWIAGLQQPPSAEAVQEALHTLQAAAQITPDDASLQERVADAHLVLARLQWADEALRVPQVDAAIQRYQLALQLRPTDPQTWASLAEAFQARGGNPAPMHEAWHQALKRGPNEGHVQPMLLEMVLSDWRAATPDMQDWAKDLFDRAAEPQRKAINEMAKRYGLKFESTPAAAEAARPSSGQASTGTR